MKNFPTLEELNVMPEVRLRNLDVSLPEEVELIQAVVNRRFPPKFKEDFRNGEIDIKTCVAMQIMDRLDIGGTFAEIHPVDF